MIARAARLGYARTVRNTLAFCASSFVIAGLLGAACSASGDAEEFESSSSSGAGAGSSTSGTGGGSGVCGDCFGDSYTPCNPDGTAGTPVVCPDACSPGVGCTLCLAGEIGRAHV